MKILLLNDRIPPEGNGGAESVVWNLAQGLAAVGHEVHIIAANSENSFYEIRGGISTWHIQAHYPERFRAWLSLWNPQTAGMFRIFLDRIKPDVVNAHNIHSWLTYHTLKLAHQAGYPVVFSSHDVMPFAYGKLRHFVYQRELQLPAAYRLPSGYNLRQNRFRYNPFRNRAIKHYLSRYAHIRTVPSQALAAAYAANNMPPVEVVHNGIEPVAWSAVNEETIERLRQRFDLVDKQVILIAGRLTADKGTLQILAALDRLRQTLPQVRLLVLTSRPIASQLPAQYQHLQPWIISGGWLSGEELHAAYQLADVVTVPSICFDTFPTVNLEAMAARKPVVATCFGGSPEVVIDGETGYIVNPLDTELYTDRLARLLHDADLRAKMGEKGSERIHTQFSLLHQLRRMEEIYQRAIAAKPTTD